MILELSGQEVLLGFMALGLILVIGILLFRFFNNRKRAITSYCDGIKVKSFSNRTKYSNKDVLRHRSRILGLGLSFSLLFTLFAMSWTTYQREVPILDVFRIDSEEIEVMPRTIQKPPAPVPIPKMKEIIPEDLIEEETDDLPDISLEINEPVSFDIPKPPTNVSPPSPPPLPEIEDEPSDIPFRIVEKNPFFGNCKSKECSERTLLGYLYKNLSYPAIARENGIEGRVTAQFVIEKDGNISSIEIVRAIGAGCDEEVVRVLTKMNLGGPTWQPGEQRGKPVRVLYTLPVIYSLK